MIGNSITFNSYDIFRLAQDNQIYLGYSRSNNSWGTETLIRIDPYYKGNFVGLYIPQTSDSSSIIQTTFYDNNVNFNGITPEITYQTVYIGKAPKGTVPTNNTSFTVIPSSEVGNLTLQYINNFYVCITGFNVSFNPSDTATYDYFLLNYNQTGLTAIKIKESQAFNSYNQIASVQLAYSLTSSAIYSTILESNLSMVYNKAGQLTLYGLPVGTSINSTIQVGSFFILNSTGNILLNNLIFNSQGVDSNNNTYINFTLNNNTVEVTSEIYPGNQLAIFSEQNIYGNINDGNPPNPSFNYLMEGYLEFSVMNPIALFQVPLENIFLAGVSNNETALAGMQTIGLNNTTYAYTQNLNLAYSCSLKNILININIAYFLQVTSIYRQVFLCLKPQDAGSNLLNKPFYNSENLFQINNYNYNLGKLLWLANKTPVNRYNLTQDEIFQIIL